MAKRDKRKFKAEQFHENYSLDKIKAMDPAEVQKQIRYFNKVIAARMQWLKGSDYEEEAKLRTQTHLYGRYLDKPGAFDPARELYAKAEFAHTNISLTGLREETKEMQTLAREIFKDYRGLYDTGTGFSEFMGALRYSGLIERFGSDVASRIYEDMVEEGGLKPGIIIANYERYVNMFR